MTGAVGNEKEKDTGVLEETTNYVDRMRDWLEDPEKYIQEIEHVEVLLDRLLAEREALMTYIKALRFWAYEVIGGSVIASNQPTDMMLLEAMMNLPEHLRKEIQND